LAAKKLEIDQFNAETARLKALAEVGARSGPNGAVGAR